MILNHFIYFYLSVFLGMFSFFTTKTYVEDREMLSVMSMHRVSAQVATCPIGNGAISLKGPGESHENRFKVAQRIVQCWKELKIADSYLEYGVRDLEADTSWSQLVPAPKPGSWPSEWTSVRQLTVMKNVVRGAGQIAEEEQKVLTGKLKEVLSDYSPVESKSEELGTDPFCPGERSAIDRQQIHEGELVRVLYNYAPIDTDGKGLHFLVTPKRHVESFHDLTMEEYVEAKEMEEKLLAALQAQELEIKRVDSFHKTGKLAGQSVPHWHLHVVFTTADITSSKVQFQALTRMFFHYVTGHLFAKLPQKELVNRVNKHKKIFN